MESKIKQLNYIRILGTAPLWFIRPKNTDWRHNFFLHQAFKKKIATASCLVSFELRKSPAALISMNGRHLRGPLGRYVPAFRTRFPSNYFSKLYTSDHEEKFDAIYAYGCYPSNAAKPVIWHEGPTNVEVLAARSVPEEEIIAEITWKARCAQVARLIAVSSQAGANAFDAQIPGHAHKIIVLPFLLPGVEAVDERHIIVKHTQTPINILFVGRDARRKGLDLLIEAFQAILVKHPGVARLTIVSNLMDGNINIPRISEVVHHCNLEHSAVQSLMRDAHIFIMPSREESFGLVYVEAMAAGAVVVAPNREPQRSLLGEGRYGLLCDISAQDIFKKIDRLIFSADLRRTIALEALAQFTANYSNERVTSCYASAFQRAA